MNTWGVAAKDHWRQHRPTSYSTLDNPDRFFTAMGEEAEQRYTSIRDGLLEGVNPNDGTIGWQEFQDRVAQADQTAREVVEREMIYLPPTGEDQAAADEEE